MVRVPCVRTTRPMASTRVGERSCEPRPAGSVTYHIVRAGTRANAMCSASLASVELQRPCIWARHRCSVLHRCQASWLLTRPQNHHVRERGSNATVSTFATSTVHLTTVGKAVHWSPAASSSCRRSNRPNHQPGRCRHLVWRTTSSSCNTRIAETENTGPFQDAIRASFTHITYDLT